uniref:Integrase core domain-containing protein n=1 Tax=Xiphophorus maculatus TaxID=8083 RepID=A0A3B5QAJ1_XIPMA
KLVHSAPHALYGSVQKELLLDHIFDRLRDRSEHVLERMPLDLDFLDFICTQELVFLNAMSCQIDVPSNILDASAHLHRLINLEKQSEEQQTTVVHIEQGPAGRQRMVVSSDYLCSLLELHLPVPCIAKFLGISSRTVYRRMAESGLSVRALYTTMSDDDLDQCVRDIKSRQPHSGYPGPDLGGWGPLEFLPVQASFIPNSSFSRRSLADLGSTGPRSYATHFTIRLWWGFVVHGGIDGCSRIVTYLSCSTDNRASTVLFHFLKARGLYECASGTGDEHRSHLTGESIHNQRIEHLWRDVFLHVLEPLYSTFYNLEDSALLDPSNDVHKLSLHIVFLPEIQSRLEQFRKAWNHHSLRTENNKTPTQIWTEQMLANMGANSRATNNVFGNNSNAPETLQELLQQHGLWPLPTTDAEEVLSVVVEPTNPGSVSSNVSQLILQSIIFQI